MGRFFRLLRRCKDWVVSLWRKPPTPKTPEQLLDETCRKMSAAVRRSKNQVQALLGSQKSLQDEINRNINKVTQLQVKALGAVGRGEDARARDLIRKKQRYEKTVKSLQEQLAKHKNVSEQIQETVRRLELKLEETKRKKILLQTQKECYETTKMIGENIEGIGGDEAVGRILSDMEEDVAYLQTEAQLTMGLDTEAIGQEEVEALPPSPDEGPQPDVEDELAAMKKRLVDSPNAADAPDEDEGGEKDDGIIFIE